MRKILLIPAMIILFSSSAFAHGTGYNISQFKAIPLEFFYSTGEKMSYREVKVFSPSDSKFAIQTGRTDEFGRFAFIPNISGDWRVIVRDEEGHQCEANIFVSGDFNEISQDNANSQLEGFNLYMRSLLGVSLIFNLAFLIKIFVRRNK